MQKKYIPFGEIGKYLGYDLNPATPHRWRQKGILHNGEYVKLLAKKIGARFFVTEEDLKQFIARLNSVTDEPAVTLDGLSLTNEKQTDQILDEFNV